MREIRTRTRRSVFAALMAVVWLTALPAAADEADGTSIGERVGSVGAAAFDVVVLRPLGLAATVGGFGCFVIAAPLLAPTWEFAYGWDTFVMGPFDYTFQRPLGDF